MSERVSTICVRERERERAEKIERERKGLRVRDKFRNKYNEKWATLCSCIQYIIAFKKRWQSYLKKEKLW